MNGEICERLEARRNAGSVWAKKLKSIAGEFRRRDEPGG
jgi:hypothetical protein